MHQLRLLQTADNDDLAKPSAELAESIAAETAAALAKVRETKASASKLSLAVESIKRNDKYVRYIPDEAAPGYNPRCAERVIRLVERQVDPLEPARFKARRAPHAKTEEPAPLERAPPKKLTPEDQAAWKIPPCISNWKNQQGYTIPLDMRLQADGRGLQEVTVNSAFAQFSEALYVAERLAREEIRMKNDLIKQKKQMEEAEREERLREIAAKARAERSQLLQGIPAPADSREKEEPPSPAASPRERRSLSPLKRRSSPSPGERRRSPSPLRRRRSPSPLGRRLSPSPIKRRRSHSPFERRRSLSPPTRGASPSPRKRRRSPSPPDRRRSPAPLRRRRSPSTTPRRRSSSPTRGHRSTSPSESRSDISRHQERHSTSPSRRTRSTARPQEHRSSSSEMRVRTRSPPRRQRFASSSREWRSPLRRSQRRSPLSRSRASGPRGRSPSLQREARREEPCAPRYDRRTSHTRITGSARQRDCSPLAEKRARLRSHSRSPSKRAGRESEPNQGAGRNASSREAIGGPSVDKRRPLDALDEVERERRREIERELRLERAGAKRRRLVDDNDRDISEKVALGQAQTTMQEDLFDARLFNRDAGGAADMTVADDDDYALYDKPLFADRSKAKRFL